MLQTTRKNLFNIVAIVAVMVALALLITPQAFAAQSEISKQVCEGVTSASGGGSCSASSNGTSVNGLINDAINILSWLIGVVAVFMIIFGGFRFVTSSGDSGKVSSARQTIIYALVGIVIVVLAQTIVKFVISQFA